MKRKWADRMMLKHWVFIGLGFCIGRGLFAAEIDSTELNSGRRLLKTAENFRTLSKEPVTEAKTTVFGELFRYQLSTGSNVLPFSMVGKMAFGGYIGSDITANIESKLQVKLVLYQPTQKILKSNTKNIYTLSNCNQVL